MSAPLATWGWWWRAGMCVVWAAYLAMAYVIARGTAGGWSGVGTVLLGMTGALGAAIFLLPLVALLDAEEVVRATVAGRRFARGECPACGQARPPAPEARPPALGEDQPLGGGDGSAVGDSGQGVGGPGAGRGGMDPCAECGASFVRPTAWVPSWTTAGRFAVVFGVALLCGAAAGEWRLRTDEAEFREEAPGKATAAVVLGGVSAGRHGGPGGSSVEWERFRPWPADFARLRYESDGREQSFSAPPPFEFERIPGWQPSRSR
jgi:hypothetical protein